MACVIIFVGEELRSDVLNGGDEIAPDILWPGGHELCPDLEPDLDGKLAEGTKLGATSDVLFVAFCEP